MQQPVSKELKWILQSWTNSAICLEQAQAINDREK